MAELRIILNYYSKYKNIKNLLKIAIFNKNTHEIFWNKKNKV